MSGATIHSMAILSAMALASVALTVATPRPALAARDPLPALTLRQLAGQRVIYSYRGPEPPRRLVAQIRAGEAAGVILFADNITGRTQIRTVIARLQHAAAASLVKQPLLILTDQEGGRVRRLEGAPELSAKQIGAARRPSVAARRAGRGGRPEPARRGHQRQPRTGPRRVPQGGELHRRVRALVRE